MNSTKRCLMGDWYCSSCHMHNFAKREECFKCQHVKDENDEVVEEISKGDNTYSHQLPKGKRLKRGDWFCSNADCRSGFSNLLLSVNFAGRRECFLCGKEKPQIPNEWICPECNYENLSFRKECKNCSHKNPGQVKLREGDWECNCGHLNFARRNCCQKCEKSRGH